MDIQWVVEWWHIKSMTSYGFKENYVILARFCHYSYYPTFHIARQFGNQ